MDPQWLKNLSYSSMKQRPQHGTSTGINDRLMMRQKCDEYNLQKVKIRNKIEKEHHKEEEEEAKVDAVLMHNCYTRDQDYQRETSARCRAVAQHQFNEAQEKRSRNRAIRAKNEPDYRPISSYSGVKAGIVPWDGILNKISTDERRSMQRTYRAQLDDQIEKRPKASFSKEEDSRNTTGLVTWETSYHQWEDNPALKDALSKWYKTDSFASNLKEDFNSPRRMLPRRPQTAAETTSRISNSTVAGWHSPRYPISLRAYHGRRKWTSEMSTFVNVPR